jgi:multicomponent Na+:H+ antiporter subunit E
VARFSYRLAAFDPLTWISAPRRWPALAALLWELTWQLVKQNITLSIRVLRPRLSIRPGIVAVPTSVRDDVALTLLGSLITLTPDTVVVDIDQQNGLMYVHWIDVQTTEPEAVRELVAAGFEKRVIRLLE